MIGKTSNNINQSDLSLLEQAMKIEQGADPALQKAKLLIGKIGKEDKVEGVEELLYFVNNLTAIQI